MDWVIETPPVNVDRPALLRRLEPESPWYTVLFCGAPRLKFIVWVLEANETELKSQRATKEMNAQYSNAEIFREEYSGSITLPLIGIILAHYIYIVSQWALHEKKEEMLRWLFDCCRPESRTPSFRSFFPLSAYLRYSCTAVSFTTATSFEGFTLLLFRCSEKSE